MNTEDLNKVKGIREQLNNFNFSHIIKLENSPTPYQYENYENGHKTKGYCTLCENDSINKPMNNELSNEFCLKNISHGTHALDILQAIKRKEDLRDLKDNPQSWSDIPVLFLFENPAAEKGEGEDSIFQTNEDGKNPSKQWYWIHGGFDRQNLMYPQSYRQNDYGRLIASIIRSFKLANAYVTNLVKCGMNKKDGKSYLSTTQYHRECIKKCYNEILIQEIEHLIEHRGKDLIIFAFGQVVYNTLLDLVRERPYNICLLPHPANR